MALTALETKPIDAITADDVLEFVGSKSIAESQTLEFKQQASNFARRRSIAALANAYGGSFVIGVVEESHVATRLQLIENCVEEANRVGQSVSDAFTPPISGLRIRGVPVDGASGVVVARVPASPRRPHATSKPGEKDALYVFVRRGLETRAVGMREVQEMTLAAATEAFRAADRIAALQAPMLARRADLIPEARPPFQVHLSAVPATPITLPRVGSDAALRPREVDSEGPFGRLVFRFLDGVWRPVFRGQRMVNERTDFDASAAVFADGACELSYVLPADRARWHGSEAELYLGWHLGALTGLLVWCEAIRKAAGEPSLEFAIGQLLACDDAGVRLQVQQGALGRLGTMPVGLAVPPPDAFAGDEDIDRLLNAAVADFYNLTGRAGPAETFHFDLDSVRKCWGLI